MALSPSRHAPSPENPPGLRRRTGDGRADVNVPPPAFRYWRDPCCLAASAAYALNRWLVPAALQAPWWRGHFADLLLIPAALPLWLWLERRLGWRADDRAPRWREVVFAVAVWALAAEGLAPLLFTRATADPWDVAAYLGGALAAGLFWTRPPA